MLNLIKKDIKNIVYDFKSLMFILVMPIALMSILGMALQGVFSDTMSSGVFDINIGIVKDYDYDLDVERVQDQISSMIYEDADFDFSDFADADPQKTFFDGFMDSEGVKDMIHYEIMTEAEAKAALEADEIVSYILLPKSFVYNGYMNFLSLDGLRQLTEVKIIKSSNTNFDFENMILNQAINSYFTSLNSYISQSKVANQVMVDYPMIPAEAMTDMRQQMMADTTEQIFIESENLPGSKQVNSFQYYAAAIMAMFMMYSASIGARALHNETKEHTFQRLEVAGSTYPLMSVSNFFRIMMIVMMQSGIMIVFSTVAMGVQWGSILNILIVLVLSGFAVAGIGTFIATLTVNFNNPKIANVFEFAVVQLMALLGGSFLPLEVLPKAFQKLQFLSLNSYVLGGYLNGMYERPVGDMSVSMVGLIGFGAIFIVLSVILMKFRKREALA